MTTRTIDTLLEIMADSEMSTHRRIEAAETLLGFEAPAEAVSRARDYLMSVFEDKEEEIGDRMDALKFSRKFEAKRIMPQTVHVTREQEVDRKKAWRNYEIWDRKRKLIMATMQIPPPNYADDLLRPDYLTPPGEEWPPTTIVRDPASGFRIVYNRDKERG
jgi:hypothetical protein